MVDQHDQVVCIHHVSLDWQTIASSTWLLKKCMIIRYMCAAIERLVWEYISSDKDNVDDIYVPPPGIPSIDLIVTLHHLSAHCGVVRMTTMGCVSYGARASRGTSDHTMDVVMMTFQYSSGCWLGEVWLTAGRSSGNDNSLPTLGRESLGDVVMVW